MSIKTVNISFNENLLREIDKFAQKEALSRSDVLRIGTKKYIQNLSEWRLLQQIGKKQALKLGFKSEDDIVNRII